MKRFEKILKWMCLICGTILIIIGIVKCNNNKNEHNPVYYEIRFDVYPIARQDTIHRVLYTKYGKVSLKNHVLSDSGNEFVLHSKSIDKAVYREIGNAIIISQKPITKEIYDSK